MFRASIVRPFPNCHWLLPVVLVAAWVAPVLLPCAVHVSDYAIALALSTIFIALWTAHLRSLGSVGWNRLRAVIVSATYDVLLLFGAVVLVALPISIVVPEYDCIGPRHKVGELILSTSSLRGEIGSRFSNGRSIKNIADGLTITPGQRTKMGIVTADGTIIVIGDDPPAVVVFEPEVAEGKIIWHCRGYPTDSMPLSCRNG